MIPEYVAYLAIQRNEEFAARNARPNAPVRPENAILDAGPWLARLRAGLGADLRRLADCLDPDPRRPAPAAAHRR